MAEGRDFLTHFVLEFIGSLILGFGLMILRVTTYGYYLLPFFALGAIATCYRVTGAHLNPAVTLACIFRTDKHAEYNKLLALMYIVAQYAGFFVAILLGWWFREEAGTLIIDDKPGDDNWWYSEAIGMEFFGSLVLVLIYLNQTSRISWLSPECGMQAVLIALSYGALVAWSSKRTGGSLNPAHGFAQNFWDQVDDGDEDAFKFIWIYTIFPLLGSLVALAVHQFIVLPGHHHANKEVAVA